MKPRITGSSPLAPERIRRSPLRPEANEGTTIRWPGGLRPNTESVNPLANYAVPTQRFNSHTYTASANQLSSAEPGQSRHSSYSSHGRLFVPGAQVGMTTNSPSRSSSGRSSFEDNLWPSPATMAAPPHRLPSHSYRSSGRSIIPILPCATPSVSIPAVPPRPHTTAFTLQPNTHSISTVETVKETETLVSHSGVPSFSRPLTCPVRQPRSKPPTEILARPVSRPPTESLMQPVVQPPTERAAQPMPEALNESSAQSVAPFPTQPLSRPPTEMMILSPILKDSLSPPRVKVDGAQSSLCLDTSVQQRPEAWRTELRRPQVLTPHIRLMPPVSQRVPVSVQSTAFLERPQMAVPPGSIASPSTIVVPSVMETHALPMSQTTVPSMSQSSFRLAPPSTNIPSAFMSASTVPTSQATSKNYHHPPHQAIPYIRTHQSAANASIPVVRASTVFATDDQGAHYLLEPILSANLNRLLDAGWQHTNPPVTCTDGESTFVTLCHSSDPALMRFHSSDVLMSLIKLC
eukprot:Blabericola_migrator_1__1167@NODE_12_length_24658_cov_176_683258_g9_i0_p4_GENE_NODE_12_length_24658_cov_176_683258_g9_i0NODE_12_length_24658_cov_176_683258_g9_i0_p4_ORF_typecomplete_len519_score59_86_NODE_12_length_24658_cov_176_683258_g9_i02268224238